jgi:hypothetical protein
LTVKYLAANNISGLSSDSKPTLVPAGSVFLETDTKLLYLFDGATWSSLTSTTIPTILNRGLVLRNPANTFSATVVNPTITANEDLQFNTEYDYFIFVDANDGSKIKAKNGKTSCIDYSDPTNADTVIKTVISNSPNGATMAFSSDVFTINSPITGYANMRPYVFRGTWDNFRGGGTRFAVGASFPNNGYVIDTSATNTIGSNKASLIRIDGIEFYNLQSNTINAGAILIEQDWHQYHTGPILNNIWMQYMWRGIHLKGPVWEGIMNDIFYDSASSTFVGNAALILEQGGHSELPKANLFQHFHGQGPTAGQLDNFFLLKDAGYNVFVDTFIDGFKYTEAPISLKGGSADNIFYHLFIIDLNTSTGTNLGAILFDGAGGSTNTLQCANNRIYDAEVGSYPKMVAFRNSAQRSYVELCYFGSAVSIDDAGAGTNNVVVVKEGPIGVGTVNAKVTSTNGLVKIRDTRAGSSNRGLSATQNGDGSTTAFNIPHGCFATPTYVNVVPATANSLGSFTITANNTNIVVNYAIAPPAFVTNLQWYWSAEVYS